VVALPDAFSPTEVGQSNGLKDAGTAPRLSRFVDVLLIAWLLGVALFAVRLAATHALFRRRLRGSNKRLEGPLAGVLADATKLMGMKAAPPVMETSQVDGPSLYGIFRPLLLLPPGFGQGLSRQNVLHVMLHELAHLQRRDHLTHWVVHALAHGIGPGNCLRCSRARYRRRDRITILWFDPCPTCL
jgi:beta-lactamase regulating signal transducer with metallopeptidase domain